MAITQEKWVVTKERRDFLEMVRDTHDCFGFHTTVKVVLRDEFYDTVQRRFLQQVRNQYITYKLEQSISSMYK